AFTCAYGPMGLEDKRGLSRSRSNHSNVVAVAWCLQAARCPTGTQGGSQSWRASSLRQRVTGGPNSAAPVKVPMRAHRLGAPECPCPVPSLRPGLVGEPPDLEAVGTASLVVARTQQRHHARRKSEPDGLVERGRALQNRIGLAASDMNDAQA